MESNSIFYISIINGIYIRPPTHSLKCYNLCTRFSWPAFKVKNENCSGLCVVLFLFTWDYKYIHCRNTYKYIIDIHMHIHTHFIFIPINMYLHSYTHRHIHSLWLSYTILEWFYLWKQLCHQQNCNYMLFICILFLWALKHMDTRIQKVHGISLPPYS